MTFTNDDLNKLKEALLTGASSISVQGRTITFRSQAELLALIDFVQKTLAPAEEETVKPRITATFNKR